MDNFATKYQIIRILFKISYMIRLKDTTKVKHLFYQHFEWVAFTAAILAMALMNPYAGNGASWCLFEQLGFSFCPGDGLGHSIAFIFRGDFYNAMQANLLGPFALIVLSARIIFLLKQNVFNTNQKFT